MRILCILCIYVLIFVQMMDSSAVNLSVPEISSDLRIDAMHASWIMNSFGTGMVIALPLANMLAKSFSDDIVLATGAAIFDVSALLCGVADSSDAFLIARFAQGIGSGLSSASAFPIMLRQFPENRTAFATSLYTSAVALGPVCGPAIGAGLTSVFGWHSIFLINLPLIGAAMVLLLPSLAFSKQEGHNRAPTSGRYTTLGFFAAFIACLQYIFDFGEQLSWFVDRSIVIAAIVAGVCGIVFLKMNRFDSLKIFNFDLFKDPNYGFGTLVLAICNGVAYCSIVILPIWLRSGKSMPIYSAAVVMSIASAVSSVGTPLIGRHLDKKYFSVMTIVSFALMSGSFFLMTTFKPDSSFSYVVLSRVVAGLAFCTLTLPLLAQSLMTLDSKLRSEGQVLSVTLRIISSNVLLAFCFGFYNRSRLGAREQFVASSVYGRAWHDGPPSGAVSTILSSGFETIAFSSIMLGGGLVFALLCILWMCAHKLRQAKV